MYKLMIQALPRVKAILLIDDGEYNGNDKDAVQIFVKKMKHIYIRPQLKEKPNGKWIVYFDNNYYTCDNREDAMSLLSEVNDAIATALGTNVTSQKLHLDR